MIFWNRIEWEAEACIAMLLMPRSVSVTNALTRTQSPLAKFEALALMGQQEHRIAGPVNQQLQRAIDGVKKLADSRNWVAHARWQHITERGEMATARNFADFDKTKTVEDLRSLEQRLADALWKLAQMQTLIMLSLQ
ncbi:hypothetical protein C8J43_103743 [Sphingomonas sp. PP-CE-1G-424]|nr:hypothetical protein C8J43_103743 [Sphingomonas sp. PP-CE-1G-424]